MVRKHRPSQRAPHESFSLGRSYLETGMGFVGSFVRLIKSI